MLIMAISLIVISVFIILQTTTNTSVAKDTLVDVYQENLKTECNENVIEKIYSTLPQCEPKQILVNLPPINDLDIIEVIPSKVEINRCDGVCHEGYPKSSRQQKGHLFHKCVPITKRNKTVEVLFRSYNNEVQCSTIELEEHTECRCGCDIESANCTNNQEYDYDYCKCRCKDKSEELNCLLNQQKFWNLKTCQCSCKAEEYRACSTGFYYDGLGSCQCERNQINTAGSTAAIAMIVILLISIAIMAYLGYRLRKSMVETKHLRNSAQQPFETQRLESSEG